MADRDVAAIDIISMVQLGEQRMPYYLYIVSTNESSGTKSLRPVAEYEAFRTAKLEAKRLRTEQPLPGSDIYKIIFAGTREEAEQETAQGQQRIPLNKVVL